jgi:hypothetical protein
MSDEPAETAGQVVDRLGGADPKGHAAATKGVLITMNPHHLLPDGITLTVSPLGHVDVFEVVALLEMAKSQQLSDRALGDSLRKALLP